MNGDEEKSLSATMMFSLAFDKNRLFHARYMLIRPTNDAEFDMDNFSRYRLKMTPCHRECRTSHDFMLAVSNARY